MLPSDTSAWKEAGETAVLPKYSQPNGSDYVHHAGFVSTKKSRDYTPETQQTGILFTTKLVDMIIII